MAGAIYDVVEIKKLVAAKLKKAFPKYGFALKTNRGGTGTLYINWYKADFNPFTDSTETYASINNYYIQDETVITQDAKDVLTKVHSITEEYNWESGSTYTHITRNFYLRLSVGSRDKNFEVIASSNRPSASATYSRNSNFDKGELLRSEAGWKAYRKTFPDGRIVYNAYKDKETAANKDDWNAIKGEIYIKAGFKWSGFGFARWGSITNSIGVIDDLFSVLSKYYQAANQPTQPTQQDSNNDNEVGVDFVFGQQYGVGKFAGTYIVNVLKIKGFEVDTYKDFIVINRLNNEKVVISDSISSPKFLIYKLDTNETLRRFEYTSITPTILADDIEKIYDDNVQQQNSSGTQANNNVFVYGENFGVPKNDGQEIIVKLESRGFTITERKDEITISKLGYTPMSIYDNGGEFSLSLDGHNSIYLRNIPYDKTNGIENPHILAILIEDVYYDEIVFINETQNDDAEKKEVEEAITALQYLANLGDQDAITAITALRYLL